MSVPPKSRQPKPLRVARYAPLERRRTMFWMTAKQSVSTKASTAALGRIVALERPWKGQPQLVCPEPAPRTAPPG
jgi:hypothetical protein